MKEYAKIAIISFIISFIVMLLPEKEQSRKYYELRASVGTLEAGLERMSDRIYDLQSRASTLEYAAISGLRYAEIENSFGGYAVARSNNFIFPISLKEIKEYSNGYKAKIFILNPYLTIFNNVSIEVLYGEERVAGKNVEKWEEQLKTGNPSPKVDLFPGRWTETSVIMAPAEKKDLAYIRVSVKTDSISPARE